MTKRIAELEGQYRFNGIMFNLYVDLKNPAPDAELTRELRYADKQAVYIVKRNG